MRAFAPPDNQTTFGRFRRPIRRDRAFASKTFIPLSMVDGILLNASPANRSKFGPIYSAKAMTCLTAALLWRPEAETTWRHEPMLLNNNDRWFGHFTPPQPGWYLFSIAAWTDQYATWRKEIRLKQDAGQDVSLEAREGQQLLTELMPREAAARKVVEAAIKTFIVKGDPAALLDDKVAAAMEKTETRPDMTVSQAIPLVADRERARSGAWYEMVPRSQSQVAGKHGTFDDCIARLPEIARLGFDVLYFTPIHPIGRINRKGKNNSLKAGPDDPGSFYAIGNEQGGHDAVHPELGTLADFRRLIAACHQHDMEVALDFAVQCSPDHPWLKASSRNGSPSARTARSGLPRTRRKNTRTSSILISIARIASGFGKRCAT